MTSVRLLSYFWMWGGFCVCFAYIPGIIGHSCGPCDRETCPSTAGCPGGVVMDPCGCCRDCARTLNQTCGGPYGLDGECDVGLLCHINPVPGQAISGLEIGICGTKGKYNNLACCVMSFVTATSSQGSQGPRFEVLSTDPQALALRLLSAWSKPQYTMTSIE